MLLRRQNNKLNRRVVNSPLLRILLRGYVRREPKRISDEAARVEDMTALIRQLVSFVLICQNDLYKEGSGKLNASTVAILTLVGSG